MVKNIKVIHLAPGESVHISIQILNVTESNAQRKRHAPCGLVRAVRQYDNIKGAEQIIYLVDSGFSGRTGAGPVRIANILTKKKIPTPGTGVCFFIQMARSDTNEKIARFSRWAALMPFTILDLNDKIYR